MTELTTAAGRALLAAIEIRAQYLKHDPGVDFAMYHAANTGPSAIIAIEAEARAAALDEARAAVGDAHDQLVPLMNDIGRRMANVEATQRALAAIDALREKP